MPQDSEQLWFRHQPCCSSGHGFANTSSEQHQCISGCLGLANPSSEQHQCISDCLGLTNPSSEQHQGISTCFHSGPSLASRTALSRPAPKTHFLKLRRDVQILLTLILCFHLQSALPLFGTQWFTLPKQL